MKYILAIDQSTAGTKALLVDQKGEILYKGNASHKQHYPKPGWVEHDPDEIIERTYQAVEELLKSGHIRKQDIVGIGISNQRETVLIWDKQTGRPVHNAVVWQCQRALSICEEAKISDVKQIIQQKTGLILSPYFPAAKIKWILDNVVGLRERAKKGEVLLGTIDTWLLWNFTNGSVHATDYSNASRTQLFNLHDLNWDQELLDLFEIPVQMLPTVMNSNASFGKTTMNGLLEEEVVVGSMMGDSHAALFGQNCFEKGMTKATYGTGSSVMMNIGQEPLQSKSGLVTSIAWSLNNQVEYVFEGNITSSGATIKWIADELNLIENVRESEVLARSVTDNGGVYFIPAFAGLGAPYWNSRIKASITGLTYGTGKAHVARAGLESIAYQIRDIVDLMSLDAQAEICELKVDGGATSNSFLMQFQADILNTDVNCAGAEELSAMGAAYMAGICVGLWEDKEQIKKISKTGMTYKARLDEAKRSLYYSGWQSAVANAIIRNK